ncbi:MAG: peptidoglycan DD-metalloendopeptidase family protein [Candidatus Moranbacteria bacterium]|nr:peptidoglycan DD-metalloendopeptidase family protein [Candidatus Moranbacteria bacterium]
MDIRKRKFAVFFVPMAAMIALGVFLSFRVSAASVSSLSDKLKEINDKIKAYQSIIDIKKTQGINLTNQIDSLEAQASKLELEIEKNQAELADVSTKVTEKETIISKQKVALTNLIREYEGRRSMTDGEIFLSGSSEDLNLFFKQQDWMVETGDRIRTLMVGISQEKAVLDEKKIEADTLREQLGQRSDYLDSTKDSKANLLAKTQADQKKYATLVDTLEEQRQQIEDEIQNLEAGMVGELNMKDLPSAKAGLLGFPLKSHVVTQGYGKTSFARKSGIYKNGFHNGYDFGTSSGSDVLAAADGKVVATGNNGRYAYGRWMAIDHGNGLLTMYGHLTSVKASRGSKVKKGDVVAKSGNTGNSTGPHLHFSVFSTKTFEVVPSAVVSSLKDIPVGATVSPGNYLP